MHQSLTLKPTNADWRVAMAFHPGESRWRVKVYTAPVEKELGGTLRVMRFLDPGAAFLCYLDQFMVVSAKMTESIDAELKRAVQHWLLGRPGIRARSSAAREHMDRVGLHASIFRYEVAQAFHEASEFAIANSIEMTHRAMPAWLLPTAKAVGAGDTLDAVHEALLDQITEDVVARLKGS